MIFKRIPIRPQFDPGRVQAVCFDLDGTLCETDDYIIEKMSRVLRWFFRFLKKDQCRQVCRRMVMLFDEPVNFIIMLLDFFQLDRFFHRLNMKNTDVQFHLESSRYQLVEGAREAIHEIHQQMPIALVSSHGEAGTLAFLEKYELTDYFDILITSQTCRRQKPFADPIIFAAQCMNVLPEHCVMVGDTEVDIFSGQAAGAQTIGVLSGFDGRKLLTLAGAQVILDSVANLPELLQSNHSSSDSAS
ncbi:MAG: HAD family hydrolase [Anaerolineaceae bacterium]|nr:HAD family hydrolase [Anaerolineaceae bacterium]